MDRVLHENQARGIGPRRVWFSGSTALAKGVGVCYNRAYVTTATGETATDAWGKRDKVVAVPTASNNDAFAGVTVQAYKAVTGGQWIDIWEPGSVCLIAQRVASMINTGLVTCCVGTYDGDNGKSGIAGLFAHGGMEGRGSAIPLETMAAATGARLAFQNVAGTGATVYDPVTGLTTVTLTGAGTALGYVDKAVDASDYEMINFGGATAADSSTERCPSGVYDVYQATGANTFTVVGDTGDGACTVNLTQKGLLTMAYLLDGRESGLVEYYIPCTGNTTTYTPMVSGTTLVLGGITMAADDEADVADGTRMGQRKCLAMLGTVVTKEMLWDLTSATYESGLLSTIKMNTAGESAILEWIDSGVPGTLGSWALIGISDAGIALA